MQVADMEPAARHLTVWSFSDAHVGTDAAFGRNSLAEAIRQSEGRDRRSPGFEWDLAVDLGDDSGSQTLPDDAEGRLWIDQVGELKEHDRSQIYNVAGNHDATRGDPDGRFDTQWWHRKWIDPAGESTETSGVEPGRRPYTVDGNWEHYAFEAGNVRFLMMADRNDYSPPVGRGEHGGYPAGAISEETYDWLAGHLKSGSDRILIAGHHHMVKNTTVATGDWEGVDHGYHGRFENGAPRGSSYIHFVGDQADSGRIEGMLERNPGALDLWLGAHTHTFPDDMTGGRSHVEQAWGGATFVNVSALSKYHGKRNVPMSRVITLTHGSAVARIRCYLHTSDYRQQGWYEAAERSVSLSGPVELS